MKQLQFLVTTIFLTVVILVTIQKNNTVSTPIKKDPEELSVLQKTKKDNTSEFTIYNSEFIFPYATSFW